MKQIGGLVKQIATASADKTQNPQSVLAARKLQDLFKHAQDFTPDSIAQMAPGDQPAAKADFVKRLNSEIQHAVALEVAFKNDDNAGAATILAQMNAEKKEGHGIYDP